MKRAAAKRRRQRRPSSLPGGGRCPDFLSSHSRPRSLMWMYKRSIAAVDCRTCRDRKDCRTAVPVANKHKLRLTFLRSIDAVVIGAPQAYRNSARLHVAIAQDFCHARKCTSANLNWCYLACNSLHRVIRDTIF